jgi:hypothetical protein
MNFHTTQERKGEDISWEGAPSGTSRMAVFSKAPKRCGRADPVTVDEENTGGHFELQEWETRPADGDSLEPDVPLIGVEKAY